MAIRAQTPTSGGMKLRPLEDVFRNAIWSLHSKAPEGIRSAEWSHIVTNCGKS